MKALPLIVPLALLGTLSVAAHGQTLLASNTIADSTPARAPRAERVDSGRAEPAKKAPAPRRHPFGLRFSGFVETAFTHSNRPNGTVIADRVFDRANNHVSLNGVRLMVEREVNAARFSVGVRADAMFGDNARWLQSPGYEFGRNGDLYQAYATLNIPTQDGYGLQVKAGRMATFLGYEVIEAPVNPNVSLGNAFYYAENFTQTGLSIEHRFSKVVDAQVRVFRGWDQIDDVNSSYSYMARVGLAPGEQTSVSFAAFTGPERSGNDEAMRSGVEVVATHKIGYVTYAVQADAGTEQRNAALPDPTRDATWWVASSWIAVDLSKHVGMAFRGDYFSDRGGSRTAETFGLVGAPHHRLASGTATLNLKAMPGVLLRPEIRYDRSNASDFARYGNEFSFGLGAVYLF